MEKGNILLVLFLFPLHEILLQYWQIVLPLLYSKIQSVFELSDGSGLAITVARYETPAHIDIDKVALSLSLNLLLSINWSWMNFFFIVVLIKVGIIPDRTLPVSFPKDEDSFCGCLQDPASACYLNKVELFSRWCLLIRLFMISSFFWTKFIAWARLTRLDGI